MMTSYKNIDEYMSNFPESVQKMLRQLRATITELVPEATEAISYGMPTFKLHGNMIHFAAYASHIGLYPGSAPIEVFKEDLKKYNTSKGTIQLPLDQPLPIPLIKRIVTFCKERQIAHAKRKEAK